MSAAVHSMALDQHLREADTTSSLVVSVRSAILGEFVRGGAKTAGGDSEMKWRTKTSASRDQKGQQQQPTETRLGASPSCPPLFEDVTVTAASSPRDAANLGSLSPGGREQEQRQEEAVLSMTRSVSFNEVVKEVLIENRHRTYGNKASRRQHFYSRAELATFKRTWYWHVTSSSSHCPVDRLLRCGCDDCMDEGRGPVQEEQENDYSHWTWEG